MRKVCIENGQVKEPGEHGKHILCCNHVGYPCNARCVAFTFVTVKQKATEEFHKPKRVPYCAFAKCIIGEI